MKTKLIMESWRRFLKENKNDYIILDESQITPNFLKSNLFEQFLNEEKDPGALSIEELESKPSDFYRQQLADMRNIDKNTEKVKQRIEKDRQLKINFRNADLEITDLKFDITMDQLGTVADFSNWSSAIINSIFGTDLEDSTTK